VEAAWNLMTMAEAVPAQVLTEGLADSNSDVRWYMTEALQKRLDNDAISLAGMMLLDNDQFVKVSAIDVFALTGGNALRPVWDIAWYTKPVHEVYVLLGRLIDSRMQPKAKAQLLVGLLKATRKGTIVPLLTSILLCYPDTAFPLLMEHFWSVSCDAIAKAQKELYRPAHILYALCRMGTRFGETLLEPLSGGDSHQQILALAGLEELARAMQLPQYKQASSEELALAARLTEGLAPPFKEHRDPVILNAIVDRVATFLTHSRMDVRDSAIRILGLMQAHDYLNQLRECLRHSEASTRTAAMFALGEIGDSSSAQTLMKAAQNGELTERRTAIGVLGHLQTQEAQAVVIQSVSDADPQIRQAAVVALGTMESEEVHAKLQELTGSHDRNVAKAAAKALYANRERRQPSEMTRKRLRRIRGTASPVSDISIEMALRVLPEVRPYEQAELTRLIAQVCRDYSGTRRALIIQKLMDRADDIYELTESGREIWRVEHFIVERYLRA
jgi:HEAT repeat protein